MCVIFLAYQKHPQYPLLLLANRDEFYNRPTKTAAQWEDFPDIYGGRDLIGGGTWLGINDHGKIAAVTNYRDPNAPLGDLSRGKLTADFLKSGESAYDYLSEIRRQSQRFSGFNLLVGEHNETKSELFYYSNRQNKIVELSSGIYGLSNALLDTPWQKVENGKRFLRENLLKNLTKEELFSFLQDENLADDQDMPDTGIGYEREKALSAIFIKTPDYGTRCSTIVTVNRDFIFDFSEENFADDQK